VLEHGGQLRKAAAHYGIPLADWLDLSTGINPEPYTPPAIPLAAWARLPEDDDGLMPAATAYYATADLLAVAGSQAAIQGLPALRAHSRVGVLHPGYAEHAHAWRQAGHEVSLLAADDIEAALPALDVLILFQPCNPSGVTFAPAALLRWHAALAARGGWLLVDEAFIEASTQVSAIQQAMPQGLIVLRSLGKFFGLAGARVGFVAAHPALLAALRERLGPWCISGASRRVAQAALADTAWHTATRARLQQQGAHLKKLLTDTGLAPSGGCGLFQWVLHPHAAAIHQRLAQLGIYTRLFEPPTSLRFGLPGSAAEWRRLTAALQQEGA